LLKVVIDFTARRGHEGALVAVTFSY